MILDINQKELETETTENKIRKSFFDKYVDKIKEFLDNAEQKVISIQLSALKIDKILLNKTKTRIQDNLRSKQ